MLSESEFDEKCGAVIAQWRKEAGFTQNEMAKKLDITRRTYISMEQGDTHIKLYTIYRIAELTNHSEESMIAAIKGIDTITDSTRIIKAINKRMASFTEDMIAASMQIFFGKHGSDLRALLHLLALYTQLPFRDRQGCTILAMNMFKVAQHHSELSDPEGFIPDLDLLDHAQRMGQEAAIKGENRYTLRGGNANEL